MRGSIVGIRGGLGRGAALAVVLVAGCGRGGTGGGGYGTPAGAYAQQSAGSTASGPSGWIDVKDLGAAGDGTTDDTAALQAALDSVGSAGAVVWLGPGTYLVSNTLRITQPGTRLLGAGAVSVITSPTTQPPPTSGPDFVFIAGVNDVSIDGLVIQGHSVPGVDGIVADGSNRLTIRGVQTIDVATGIDIGSNGSTTDMPCDDVDIERTEHWQTHGVEGQGIHLDAGSHIRVHGSTAHDIGSSNLDHGIYVGRLVTLAEITGNRTYNNAGFGIQVNTDSTVAGAGGQTNTIDIHDNLVAGNGTAGAGMRGGIFTNAAGTRIHHNMLSGNQAYGISMVDPWGPVDIESNTVQGSTNAVYLESGTATVDLDLRAVEVRVRGNHLLGYSNGVRVVTTANPPPAPAPVYFDILDNVIDGGSASGTAGVYTTDATVSYIRIADNRFRGNTEGNHPNPLQSGAVIVDDID